MLRIGLTGGIGSGKSTVCRLFAHRGVPIIDTDRIAHEIVEPGQPGLDKIVETFGKSVLDHSGHLDRSKLRRRVFLHPEERQELEAVLHPLIRQRMRQYIAEANNSYVILAIPLLLEKEWQGEVDRILVIDTTEELQRSRTITRDGIDTDMVNRIMQSQVSRQERMAAADDIIHNVGAIVELEQQVELLHKRYLKLSSHST